MKRMLITGMIVAFAVLAVVTPALASGITEPGVPEIGPGSISAGLALLAGGVLMLRARRRK